MLLYLIANYFKYSLDPDQFKKLTHQKEPIVVRFMSEHRSRSVQLNSDWTKFVDMYGNVSGINIAHVNCGKWRSLCLLEGAWDTPSYRIYYNNTHNEYEGGMSYESLGEWTRRYSGIAGYKIQYDLLSPNNRTFHDLVDSKHCVFTMFHQFDQKAKKILPKLQIIAKAFNNEPNVSIAEIDVDKFKSFYFDYKLRKLPEFILHINGKMVKYDQSFEPDAIVDFLNDYCGTERSLSGLLTSDAGVVDDVSGIVEDFMIKLKSSYIAEMRNHEGVEYYVEIMERIEKEGTDWIFIERNRIMEMISKEDSANSSLLDNLRKKANILSVFLSFL